MEEIVWNDDWSSDCETLEKGEVAPIVHAPQPEEEEVASNGLFMLFEIASTRYGIPLLAVREVINIPELHPIAGSPSFILGMMSLRGSTISVIDFGKWMGKEGCRINDRTCVIIIEISELAIGVVVDNVAEIKEFIDCDIDREVGVRTDGLADVIYGVTKEGVSQVVILDIRGFIQQLNLS